MGKFLLLLILGNCILGSISLTTTVGIFDDKGNPQNIDVDSSVFLANVKPLKFFSKGDENWNMCTWTIPFLSNEACVFVELDTAATHCPAPMTIYEENGRCILDTGGLDDEQIDGQWASEIRSTATNASDWGPFKVKPIIEPNLSLNFESGSPNFEVDQMLEITCTARTGQPKPQLQWFLDYQNVSNNAPPQDDSNCDDSTQCLVSRTYSIMGSTQLDGSVLRCTAQQTDFLMETVETNVDTPFQLGPDNRNGLDTWVIVTIVLGCLLVLLLIILLILALCFGWCCFGWENDFVEPYEEKDNLGYCQEEQEPSMRLRYAQTEEVKFQKTHDVYPFYQPVPLPLMRNDWNDAALDELRNYRYEGQGHRRGSAADSLSSLETLPHYDNIDFEKYFRPLGPRFEKLANLYDRRKSVWPEYDSDWSHISDIPFEESVI
ncbi:hypothetical protein TCAL_16651 [Tigriopus californicus]|uniref:Ig-like domain-containing protein n=1 Tax=Tigriopus californicus TaxID=6832 RepID=A0A553NB17_TIGCA|nr:hypothetical protein TCAL_16651 [Tigriopus californicus]